MAEPQEKDIDFLHCIGLAKLSKRAGWRNNGIKNIESVSDHMHRMALGAWLWGDRAGVDTTRAMKMALIHDIAEGYTGDITPADGIPKPEKKLRETEAFSFIQSLCTNEDMKHELWELWQEYENCSSAEAKFVKDLDKIEMLLQAWEYEKLTGVSLQGFFDSTVKSTKTAVGDKADFLLRRQREQRRAFSQPARPIPSVNLAIETPAPLRKSRWVGAVVGAAVVGIGIGVAGSRILQKWT